MKILLTVLLFSLPTTQSERPQFWNERTPYGIETLCGDPDLAVNVVDWGVRTDSCL